MSNISNQLALLPFGILLAAAENLGQTVADKSGAVDALTSLIDGGYTTLDIVKATKPVKAKPVAATEDLNKIVEVLNDTASKTGNLVHAGVLRDIEITDVRAKLHSIESTFGSLEQKINAKLSKKGETINKSELDTMVRSAVSDCFNQFRKARPVEELEAIAAEVPSVINSTAGEVFGAESCVYDGIDFSALPVLLWSDPEAPELVNDYVFDPAALHQALIALDDPLPDNVWLAGERGTGKTEFVNQIAARLGRKLFRVNFDEALERADFIGGNTIENGTVVWKGGIITKAVSHTGALVLLDEIGFARAQSLAALHALCERSPHRSLTVSETGERIKVASHVAFFGADNSNGFGDTSGNFAGVREQNSAFIDRFSYTIRFEYLPADKEAELIATRTNLSLQAAQRIVVFANTAREKARAGLLTQPPSLRQLFAWARAIQKGLPIRIAFENAIVNKYPEECSTELHGVFAATIDTQELAQII
jgi:MoxR-like ATPase